MFILLTFGLIFEMRPQYVVQVCLELTILLLQLLSPVDKVMLRCIGLKSADTNAEMTL